MIRPDVEHIAAETDAGVWKVQWTRELIAYIHALEVAWDTVLPEGPAFQPPMGWTETGRLRDAFDAAVARWQP